MHTVIVILVGLLILAACLGVGWFAKGSSHSLRMAAWVFSPLWLVGSGANLWYGVSHAGYAVRDEFPIFVVVFVSPVLVAGACGWRFR